MLAQAEPLTNPEDILRLALFRGELSHVARRTLNHPGYVATVPGRSDLPGDVYSANPALPIFQAHQQHLPWRDDFPEEAKP